MKNLVIIIFLINTFNSFSQNWKLNNIDNTKEYVYQYIFSFQNEDDNNEFNIIEIANSNSTELIGYIYDKLNNPISAASIVLISKSKIFEKKLQADFTGVFKVDLPIGSYMIEIDYPEFDKFTTEFTIQKNFTTQFKVNLGLGEEIRNYQIDSKNELKNDEILNIIECVSNKRKSKNFKAFQCSEKEKFIVSIQI